MNPAAQPVTLAQCVSLLEARRRWVCDEMRGYGSPVAACDADYNALVAERAEIGAVLSRLEPIARAEMRVAHPRED